MKRDIVRIIFDGIGIILEEYRKQQLPDPPETVLQNGGFVWVFYQDSKTSCQAISTPFWTKQKIRRR